MSATSNKLQRSLSGDFDKKDGCSPAKKIKVELHHQSQLPAAQLLLSPQGTTKSATSLPVPQIPSQEIPLTALKPLLSYSDNQNTNQPKKIAVASIQPNQRPIPNSPNLFASLVASKPVKTVTVDNSKPCRPLLVPNLSKTNGGVFQIIPIQYKPLKGVRDKPIHAVPVVLGQQPQAQNGQQQQQHGVTAMSPVSNNVLTMLMRPPIVTVTSPSVLLSPRNSVLKKPAAELLTQQIIEKYPEYFTPPHNMQNPGGKPAANPIIFPKMTPETPSSEPKGALNAVTRKLMSFQNEDEQR